MYQSFWRRQISGNKPKLVENQRKLVEKPLEIIWNCFLSVEAKFNLADIAKFMAGSPTITPGINSTLKLYFRHNFTLSCKCLPVASTCPMHIILPVHTRTLHSIIERFYVAVTSTASCGFGFAWYISINVLTLNRLN